MYSYSLTFNMAITNFRVRLYNTKIKLTDPFHSTRLTIKHASVSLGVAARAEKTLNVKVTESHVLQHGGLSSCDVIVRIFRRQPLDSNNCCNCRA